jgi:hypothetical protein
MSRSAQNCGRAGAVCEICTESEVSGCPIHQALLVFRLRARSCRKHPSLNRHYWLYLYLAVDLQAEYRVDFDLHLVIDEGFLQIVLLHWLVVEILLGGLL